MKLTLETRKDLRQACKQKLYEYYHYSDLYDRQLKEGGKIDWQYEDLLSDLKMFILLTFRASHRRVQ